MTEVEQKPKANFIGREKQW